MTRMMVRVANAHEAAQAAAAGVDLVEFRLSHADHLEIATVQAIRAEFPGSVRLRADGANIVSEILAAAADAHADEVALPLSCVGSSGGGASIVADTGVRLVAEFAVPTDAPETLGRIRSQAIMFGAGSNARILDVADIADLEDLAETCRANGLPFGFAGGLEAPDVARLLLLAPDVLGFDTAVRVQHDPAGPIDVAEMRAIRALLPSETPPAPSAIHTVRDRLFVRNFVVPLSIGAYRAERGALQRVRFSVEVEILREPQSPHDMRDVFSYDIIIETIRRLARRAHVTFVETLAEEIAAALLEQYAVLSTTVSVEKLDIIDGEVGIQIHRRRRS